MDGQIERPAAVLGIAGAGLAHVLERDDDLEVELLRDGPRRRARCRARRRRSARSPPAAAASRRARSAGTARPVRRAEPLERERQVRAALRARDRVHLVEDHRLDRREHRLRLRGEDEEERLGRRDEDVRRVSLHPRPLVLRRVAGAHRDGELGADTRERPAQVALDVVVERLQRADVEHLRPLRPARRGRARRGTRRASSPSRSAPGSACASRRRSPASRAPAQASARRTSPRTTRGPRG